MAHGNSIPTHETYLVFIDATTGTRMVYEINYATMEVEYPQEDYYGFGPISQPIRPESPEVTVRGRLVRGKIWRDEAPNFFEPEQQGQIKPIPKEIEG